MKRLIPLATVACLAVGIALLNVETTQATPPSGATAPFTYRATVDSYHFDSNDYKIFQKNSEDVVMRQIVLAPGGNNGWHFHPGPVLTIVTQGTLTLYEANDPTCAPHNYSAGQGFVETPLDVHIARNEGTVPVIAVVTFLDVPIGGAFRLDAPNPGNCPF